MLCHTPKKKKKKTGVEKGKKNLVTDQNYITCWNNVIVFSFIYERRELMKLSLESNKNQGNPDQNLQLTNKGQLPVAKPSRFIV